MSKQTTIYTTLVNEEVNHLTEKKGKFTYLSWAYAWAKVKSLYPESNRTVYESEHTGLNYFTDGNTAYVKVGVTIEGLEHIDYLPIMDFKNNSIKVENVTSFNVNKTIQRSMVKAIAMHGLGLSLWAGEDMPGKGDDYIEQEAQPKPKPKSKSKSKKIRDPYAPRSKKPQASLKAMPEIKQTNTPDPKRPWVENPDYVDAWWERDRKWFCAKSKEILGDDALDLIQKWAQAQATDKAVPVGKPKQWSKEKRTWIIKHAESNFAEFVGIF